MQIETLTQIKSQIVLLDDESKKDLADFLAEELTHKSESSTVSNQQEIEWLKQNREKYAGKYVALCGNEFICEGKNLHETKQTAIEKGFENPFVTFVYSETEVPFGGW